MPAPRTPPKASSKARKQTVEPATTPTKSKSQSKEPARTDKAKKQRSSMLNSLLDGLPDAKTTSSGHTEHKAKACKTFIFLATHMQGEKKGELSGKAFFAICCAYAENEAMISLVKSKMHQVSRARLFQTQ